MKGIPLHSCEYGAVRRYRASRGWASGRSWGSSDCLITADMKSRASWPVDCLSPTCKVRSVSLCRHFKVPSTCEVIIVRVCFSTMHVSDKHVHPTPGSARPIIFSNHWLTRSRAARRRCAHGTRHRAFTYLQTRSLRCITIGRAPGCRLFVPTVKIYAPIEPAVLHYAHCAFYSTDMDVEGGRCKGNAIYAVASLPNALSSTNFCLCQGISPLHPDLKAISQSVAHNSAQALSRGRCKS